MKLKNLGISVVIIVGIVLITGCAEQIEEQAAESAEETAPVEEIPEKEIFCPDHDRNQEECLSHPECEWDTEENDCDPIGGMGEKEDEKVGEEDEENEFASELEKDLPDTIPNQICKKLPLTNGLNPSEIRNLSPSNRYYCFAVVNQNAEFCNEIVDEGDDEEKNEVNLCLAHAKQDVSYCKKISDNGDKKHCYFGLSLISGDIDVCDSIDYDRDERQLCYWSFVNALYWEDKSDKITTEHCNKLPAGSEDRNTCLAFKERDVSLCKNNVNCLTCFEQEMSFCTTGKGKVLEYCIRDRAMTSKDLSICETLTGEKRDDCIGDYAGHISQDISTCNKITGYFARNTCYKDVAIQSSTIWLAGLRDN